MEDVSRLSRFTILPSTDFGADSTVTCAFRRIGAIMLDASDSLGVGVMDGGALGSKWKHQLGFL